MNMCGSFNDESLNTSSACCRGSLWWNHCDCCYYYCCCIICYYYYCCYYYYYCYYCYYYLWERENSTLQFSHKRNPYWISKFIPGHSFFLITITAAARFVARGGVIAVLEAASLSPDSCWACSTPSSACWSYWYRCSSDYSYNWIDSYCSLKPARAFVTTTLNLSLHSDSYYSRTPCHSHHS